MYKIGHAYDIHRLVENRPLILGGIKIPYSLGLDGHSDADVLLHVIAESMIGALCLGDLGTLFPDTDPQYKDINSMTLLMLVIEKMFEQGFRINNLDATIFAEAPKLRAYIDKMRENIAHSLAIKTDQINIKATTGERLGFIGRSEGIAAECTILLIKK